MSIHIGLPQALLLFLYSASLVINCVKDGEQTETHWWAVAASLAIQLAILTWGGFFS